MSKIPNSLFSFFLHFIGKQPLSFLFISLAPISIILESNVIPYALKMLIDTISGYNFYDNKAGIIIEIWPALALAGGAWVVMIVITRTSHFLESYVIPRFQADIRMSVFNYVIGHSYRYFSDNMSGEVANKVSDLPDSLEKIREVFCWNVVGTIAVIIVSFTMMLDISPVFSSIILIWSVTHIIIAIYYAKFINNASKENAECKSRLSGRIVDTISNMMSVKLFSAANHGLSYVGEQQNEEKKTNANLMRKILIFQLFIDIPASIMLASITYFLIIRWQQNIISAGDFIFIFNVTMLIIFHMMNLGHVLTQIFKEIGRARQAISLLTEKYEIVDAPDAKSLEAKEGKIKISNVTFGYSNKQKVFNKQNITFDPGSKVGLVGYSGSGKSTLINLILRFYDLNDGTIEIDNQNIVKVTQDSLRNNITMIPQDTILFHRSLIDNIRYGKVDATEEEIITASKKAHCHEFISQLPNSYDTMVGERGTKLSGGQKQRIAIARAMLRNAPILILDEATSALDSVTEKYIQDTLYSLMKNKTTIVIAHRLSTITEMDRIIVFDNGKIIEDGTHQELIKKNGHYTKMWNMQANGFLPLEKANSTKHS